MVSVFGKDVDAAADKMSKATIKGKEFAGKGLTLQFKSVERQKSEYGAESDDSIVEKGILEEGETFAFKFYDVEGDIRTHYSKSMPFFIGMKQVEFNEGDWLQIRREGETTKTRFYVEAVDAPKGFSHAKNAEKQIDPKDIPF